MSLDRRLAGRVRSDDALADEAIGRGDRSTAAGALQNAVDLALIHQLTGPAVLAAEQRGDAGDRREHTRVGGFARVDLREKRPAEIADVDGLHHVKSAELQNSAQYTRKSEDDEWI